MNETARASDCPSMSSVGLRYAARLLDEGAQQGLYPGGVLWVGRGETDAVVHSVGVTEFGGSVPVDERTVFDMASVTKPVATATAALLLAQEGHIHFGMPIGDFFPQRRLPQLADVSLRHLITHTSGLPAWRDLYSAGQDRERAIDDLFAVPMANAPGSTYVYSCLGYIMLGLALEHIAGQGLEEYCRTRIFDPLEMRDTGSLPNPRLGTAVAATDNCPLRKTKLVGQVHDGNAHILGGVSGNAGLFSTAADLARYCRAALSCAGEGAFPLNAAVRSRMYCNAIAENIGGQTFGWFTYPNEMMPAGDFVSHRAIGHSGFTGTCVVIDPAYGVFLILLTNRVCQEGDGTEFRHLRRRIANAVLGSVLC